MLLIYIAHSYVPKDKGIDVKISTVSQKFRQSIAYTLRKKVRLTTRGLGPLQKIYVHICWDNGLDPCSTVTSPLTTERTMSVTYMLQTNPFTQHSKYVNLWCKYIYLIILIYLLYILYIMATIGNRFREHAWSNYSSDDVRARRSPVIPKWAQQLSIGMSYNASSKAGIYPQRPSKCGTVRLFVGGRIGEVHTSERASEPTTFFKLKYYNNYS